MKFDIITLNDTELSLLSVVQMKLLRTAQQKKDELEHKRDSEYALYKAVAQNSGLYRSSMVEDKYGDLGKDLEFSVGQLRDNLLYNMSLNEPTNPDDMGDSGVDDRAGYIVDYSLPYMERYINVRNYYLSIPNPVERMVMYNADETAKKYLGNYYDTLYDVLENYSN